MHFMTTSHRLTKVLLLTYIYCKKLNTMMEKLATLRSVLINLSPRCFCTTVLILSGSYAAKRTRIEGSTLFTRSHQNYDGPLFLFEPFLSRVKYFSRICCLMCFLRRALKTYHCSGRDASIKCKLWRIEKMSLTFYVQNDNFISKVRIFSRVN